MATSVTIRDLSIFPEGTSVGIYLDSAFKPTFSGGAPPTSAIQSQTVTSGAATFNGLTDETMYRVGAEVSGVWHYVSVSTGDSETNVQAALDAAASPSASNPFLTANESAQVVSVKAYGATGDGVTDDTAALQAALTAARTAGGGIVFLPPGTFQTTAVLEIGSNTTLQLAPGAILRTATNSGCSLLRNYNATRAGRDSNIIVRGGTLYRGTNTSSPDALSLMQTMFYKVDGITVENTTMSVQGTSGKYSLWFYDCTRYRASNIYFDNTNSDGVHVTGPSYDGVVENITGKTGDDAVALCGRDYSAYEVAGGGDIKRCTIQNVSVTQTATTPNGVKVLPGSGVTCDDILIDGVHGSIAAYPVVIYDDVTNASTSGGTIGKVTVRNVHASSAQQYYAVAVKATSGLMTVDDVVIENVHCPTSTMGGVLFEGSPVKSATIRNLTSRAAAPRDAVRVMTTASVDRLEILSPRVTLDAAKTTGKLVNVGGTVKDLSVMGGTVKNGVGVVWCNAATPPTRITLGGGLFLDDSNAGVYVMGNGAYDIHLAEVRSTSITVMIASASPTVKITATSGFQQTSGATFYRSATQTTRVASLGFPIDLSKVTGTAGDMAYNSNAGLSCGSGPCVYNGTSWKHLHTGATY